MRVTMIGSGYVGLVSGACFSQFGHHVICVDKDESKIAALKDGDIITLDIPNRRLEIDISDSELQERLRACVPPPPTHTTGALAKYAKLVSSASIGAITE